MRSPVPARGEPARGLARALLGWAAGANDGRSLEGALGQADERQLQHIVDAGLAPLLQHAVRDTIQGVPQRWRDVLKSAELTARFTQGALRDSANQLIDTCDDLGVPLIFLKGISISDQCYPEPHLRPMGDIDVLLPEREYSRVEAALLRLGYLRMTDFHVGGGEAHGAPLQDPHRGVWVEPHTALFDTDARVGGNSLFGPADVARRSIASTFHGRPIRRLTDELQLTYIAAYWVRDITRNAIHPTLLIPLFDALFLLRSSAQTLDWDGLLDSLDNEMAIASLYILLAQARRFGFDEVIAPVLPRLAAKQRIVGAMELGVINAALDFRLVDGRGFMGSFGDRHPMIEFTVGDTLLTSHSFARKVLSLPWNLVFPPRAPDRYRVGYHTGRIARFFRGRR